MFIRASAICFALFGVNPMTELFDILLEWLNLSDLLSDFIDQIGG